jgi:hypothetical protein
MIDAPPPELSEDEFNARLAQNIAQAGVHMKTLEDARQATAGLRESNDAVEDLRRLREILMEHVERTGRQATGLLRNHEYEACDHKIDPAMKCVRLARAVRQSIVLQQELLGLRLTPGMRFAAATAAAAEKTVADALERAIAETPDSPDRADEACEREDLRDRDDTYDYDDRPYDEVVEAIRAEFKIPAEVTVKPKAAPAGVANTPTIRRQMLASGAAVPNSRLIHGPP